MSRPSIEELRFVIEDEGSIRKAAPFFGVDERTLRRWLDKSEDVPETAKSPMKILAIDIETRPNLAYVWDLWNQNISLPALRESVSMLCFVAKWIHEGANKTPYFESEFHSGRSGMVHKAWDLVNTADVVVHYNGVKFDVPHLNREFIQQDLPPTSPFKQVDLLKVVKKKFEFPSNKLAYVAPALGLEDKGSHEGYGLWLKCMDGDADAWERMKNYNMQDVELLDQLYHKLLPWIDNHPSHGAMMGKDVCPSCASSDLRSDGLAYLRTGQYPRFKCGSCGVFSRDSKRSGHTNISAVTS